MSKSSHFFGQPVYGQLIKSLDREKIVEISRKYNGERYVKSFDTRVRDKKQILLALKKLNRQLEKVADSFGNIIDI